MTDQARYWIVRDRLDDLLAKYSGRATKGMNPDAVMSTPDAKEYRALMREWWGLPVPAETSARFDRERERKQ